MELEIAVTSRSPLALNGSVHVIGWDFAVITRCSETTCWRCSLPLLDIPYQCRCASIAAPMSYAQEGCSQ